MSPPIRDGLGNDIGAIRLGDGTEISEVRTGAGDVLFSGSAIPDTSMFQSPLYQYTAIAGLSASDGQTANNWTEQLAGAGDATAINTPVFRADQAGFEAVEYNGTDEGHDFPSDGQLPTGSGPVSFAATIYAKSTNNIQAVASYGNSSGGSRILFGLDDGAVRTSLFGGFGNATGGSFSSGQWATIGGVVASNDLESYLNGSSVATDTSASPSLNDTNRSIARSKAGNRFHADIYLNDLVVCDTRETDQAFSDYDTDRLG